jgi:hypothetical protein
VFTAASGFTASGSSTLQASVDDVTQQQELVFNALPVATSMVTDGLMAYFPVNEGQGTTIGDVSGNGYLGTFGGSGNLWTNAGVSFNGNGWIDLPADLNAAQTIQMWIDVPTLGPSAAQTLVGTTANGTGNALSWVLNNQAFALWLSGGSGSISATPLMGSATSTFVEGSSSLNTIDQFWINGDQAYIREPSISAVAGLVLGGHLQVGAGEGVNNLSGTVGPIAFYNRPLTSRGRKRGTEKGEKGDSLNCGKGGPEKGGKGGRGKGGRGKGGRPGVRHFSELKIARPEPSLCPRFRFLLSLYGLSVDARDSTAGQIGPQPPP